MQQITRVVELRSQLQALRCQGKTIALVPTMGNLHEGHLRLVDRARECADVVVTSIFVNPTQFGPNEDYDRYPRTLEADAEQLRRRGCDWLFAPPVEEVYPHGLERLTRLTVPELANKLCGASRPGHFDGVCTVVARLFNLVQPDVAVFGEKDRQQWLILQHMARDLGFPVRMVSLPTVREPDGLAMSSRNQYLGTEERAAAPQLYQTLQWMAGQLRSGETDYRQLERAGIERLQQAGFRPDYLQITCLDQLDPLQKNHDCQSGVAIFAAAYLGQARLIDNLLIQEES